MAGVVAEADPGEELRHAHLLLFRNLLPAEVTPTVEVKSTDCGWLNRCRKLIYNL